MYYFTFFEIRAQFVKAGRFLPWTRPDIMSLYLIHTVLQVIRHYIRHVYIVISIYANRTKRLKFKNGNVANVLYVCINSEHYNKRKRVRQS